MDLRERWPSARSGVSITPDGVESFEDPPQWRLACVVDADGEEHPPVPGGPSMVPLKLVEPPPVATSQLARRRELVESARSHGPIDREALVESVDGATVHDIDQLIRRGDLLDTISGIMPATEYWHTDESGADEAKHWLREAREALRWLFGADEAKHWLREAREALRWLFEEADAGEVGDVVESFEEHTDESGADETGAKSQRARRRELVRSASGGIDREALVESVDGATEHDVDQLLQRGELMEEGGGMVRAI
jgi:hypothetical protein